MSESTLPELLAPLMEGPSVRLGHCAVCGRPHPLNQHHVVRRGAGRLYRAGVEAPKPTITLCGMGNQLRDSDGRYLCHGLAHHEMLHFRWAPDEGRWGGTPGAHAPGGGHWEYLRTNRPVGHQAALGMDGWRRLRTRGD